MRDNSKYGYLRVQRTSKIHSKRNKSLGYELIGAIRAICSEFIGDEKALVPNPHYGEALMCVKNSITYSTSDKIRDARHLFENGSVEIIRENFMDADVKNKYNYILFFPDEILSSNMMCLIKALKYLSEGGLLVAVLPTYVLFSDKYDSLRSLIASKNSLKAVFDIKNISRNIGMELSVVIIENSFEQKEVYMCNISSDFGDTISKHKSGFLVDKSELCDRFDVDYYNTKYKMIKSFIGDKDTVKLDNIADVFELKSSLEYDCLYDGYVVIDSSCICDKAVNIRKERFLNRDIVEQNNLNKYILQKGDILICLRDNHDWAIYDGKDNYAFVDRDIAVIRASFENRKWINLFFNTDVGVEYFEGQLEYFSILGLSDRIDLRYIKDLHILDSKVEYIIKNTDAKPSVGEIVATLFKNLNWDVVDLYESNGYFYDLALFDKGKLRAVVDTRFYRAEDLFNNERIVSELNKLKANIGDVEFYVFIDEKLFLYEAQRAVQLSELPTSELVKSRIYFNKYKERRCVLIDKLDDEQVSVEYRFVMSYLAELIKKIDNIEDIRTSIEKKLEVIYKQITGYQSLVKRQLYMVSEADKDIIIDAFIEECLELIIKEIKFSDKNGYYSKEAKKLKNMFGNDTWDKMDGDSKNYLVLARIVYDNLVNLDWCVDYSVVCILVIKALEVELKRKSDEDIRSILNEYAQDIEYIRVNYREASVFSNSIKRIEADNCLNFLIYIEKFMKKILNYGSNEADSYLFKILYL